MPLDCPSVSKVTSCRGICGSFDFLMKFDAATGSIFANAVRYASEIRPEFPRTDFVVRRQGEITAEVVRVRNAAEK